ncbi:MAG: ABC transporter ATP-binding protein/permease [Oscillospiraceae bacterium]|nr:ABC transporter ATP-binding protein/permease [Oscillospiraceae bacterium]
MKKLLRFLADYKKECALGPLFKMLEATFELLVPFVVRSMIDDGIGCNDTRHIIRMCLLMALLAAVGLTSTLFAQYFAAKAAAGFSAKLRQALMQHIQRMTYTDLDTLGTSSLVTRMTSDVNQVQTGVNLTIRLLLRSPFIVFGAMISAFLIDVRAALIFAVAIPLLSVVVFGIMLISIPMHKKVQEHLDTVTDITRENLDGVRVIRAFRNEDAEAARFRRENDALAAVQEAVGRISAVMNPATYVIVNLAVIGLLSIGAIRVDAGLLTQGSVIALYNLMSQILVELIKFANLIISITKAAACGNRIQAVLESGTAEALPETAQMTVIPENRRGEIVFDHVTFTYAGASVPALSDISFSAKRGEVIGVIGGTGAGKSTLVNLIPRFYEPDSGSITVDGIPAQAFPQNALRKRIGVVPQKAVLFHGTIRENLLWGDSNASDAAIEDALRTAQALDVVRSKAKGLDEEVREGGRNFSGGQRQRLTIARALVRRPEFLILDDSASALDYATDAALRQSLRALPDSPTVFIVSQRTASISQADRILVLDDGQLAGIGTHEELLQSCAVYQEIHASQFPEEVQHEKS